MADFVTICLTCFSKYLVLQHCRSSSQFTRPLARVWPVIVRYRPKFSANSLRSFPVNSSKFSTILEVAIALASSDLRPSWRLVFLFFFFFLPRGCRGPQGHRLQRVKQTS